MRSRGLAGGGGCCRCGRRRGFLALCDGGYHQHKFGPSFQTARVMLENIEVDGGLSERSKASAEDGEKGKRMVTSDFDSVRCG